MSIATDEAAQKYPEPTDADDPMCKYVEAIAGYPAAKRQGYVAGRTAELTEAEIEEAAIALYKGYFDSRGHPISYEIAKHDVETFNGSSQDLYDPDVNYAKESAVDALTAARKAVSE